MGDNGQNGDFHVRCSGMRWSNYGLVVNDYRGEVWADLEAGLRQSVVTELKRAAVIGGPDDSLEAFLTIVYFANSKSGVAPAVHAAVACAEEWRPVYVSVLGCFLS